MRQMPHGQWVAFEADEPHNCNKRPLARPSAPQRPAGPPIDSPAEPFTPFYPKVSESNAPNSNPIRSQPAPSPPSRVPGLPIPNGSPPTPRPISARQSPTPQRALPTPSSPLPTPQSVAPPRSALPHRPNRLSVFFGLLTGLLGSTVGIAFAIFGLLSLPLSVVATMHLTGWPWFSSMICVLVFTCIPFVGQLGYLILAVMGAYYLWTANFDWQQAAYPPTQTFSVSTLSETELERFKTDVVRRGFEKACKSDAIKTLGFDGKLPTRAADQCECFAKNFAANLTRDDLIAYEKSGQYTDELQKRLGLELHRLCPN